MPDRSKEPEANQNERLGDRHKKKLNNSTDRTCNQEAANERNENVGSLLKTRTAKKTPLDFQQKKHKITKKHPKSPWGTSKT